MSPTPRRPLALAALTSLALTGCGGDRRPSTAILDADDFHRNGVADAGRPTAGADRSGVVIYDPDRPNRATPYDGSPDRPAVRDDDADAGRTADAPGPDDPVRSIGPVVAQGVPTDADRRPDAAGQDAGGQYMTVGGVVARVNGRPIFSDDVLALAAPALREAAGTMSAQQFEPFAAAQIRDATRDLVRDELEVAAAERNLSPEDRAVADDLTGKWREQQIANAGGSLSAARQRAAAEGQDFDDLLRRKNRDFLRQIYYQKKVVPRVQVTVGDMRRYYQTNLAGEFTQPAKLDFRVIKFAAAERGGPDGARAAAQAAVGRVNAGDEFAAVASAENDDAMLKRSGGDPGIGLIERGAYRVTEVENAAAALPPGGVAGPVAAGDDAYVVKLVRREGGGVTSFDDAQDAIRNKLQLAQFVALQEQTREQLEGDASRDFYPEMLAATLDLAKMRYVGG